MSAKRPTDDEFARFAELLHYRRIDLSQPEHYAGLKHWVDERSADTVVLYLATSPHLFPQICAQLGAVGLNGADVRVVLEKPLGHDLASAQQINRVVRASFSESQALRIDHYLGKPAVQNLAALRFGNALFEPLWRRESIANIQITIAERSGRGHARRLLRPHRALRDMVQNHALQLLTMIAMEPPATGDADSIRDEKLKVLRSLKPFTAEQRGPRRGARAVPRRHGRRPARAGLPRRSQGAAGQPLRDVRRAAHRGAELALGRGAVLPAHGQAPGRTRCADRRQLPARAAPDIRRHRARQQAGHQAATRRWPRAAPAGRQGWQQRVEHAGASVAGVSGPGLRQGVSERARRCLRAAAARCARRPPESVRAQRRAGAGVALGRARARGLAQRQHRPAPLRRRYLGAAGVERVDRARRLRLGREE